MFDYPDSRTNDREDPAEDYVVEPVEVSPDEEKAADPVEVSPDAPVEE